MRVEGWGLYGSFLSYFLLPPKSMVPLEHWCLPCYLKDLLIFWRGCSAEGWLGQFVTGLGIANGSKRQQEKHRRLTAFLHLRIRDFPKGNQLNQGPSWLQVSAVSLRLGVVTTAVCSWMPSAQTQHDLEFWGCPCFPPTTKVRRLRPKA